MLLGKAIVAKAENKHKERQNVCTLQLQYF